MGDVIELKKSKEDGATRLAKAVGLPAVVEGIVSEAFGSAPRLDYDCDDGKGSASD
jgi:hypothetical protein